MEIPPFDHNFVLPPVLTDELAQRELSPYPCEILELCKRFGYTAPRRQLLKGLLEFRMECTRHHVKGWQWIDGSFVENIEESEDRAPKDIDVITMYMVEKSVDNLILAENFPAFVDPDLTLEKYGVDHQPANINEDATKTVAIVKYWLLTFGHNRRGVWKGMLQIPLYETTDKDMEALAYLNSLE